MLLRTVLRAWTGCTEATPLGAVPCGCEGCTEATPVGSEGVVVLVVDVVEVVVDELPVATLVVGVLAGGGAATCRGAREDVLPGASLPEAVGEDATVVVVAASGSEVEGALVDVEVTRPTPVAGGAFLAGRFRAPTGERDGLRRASRWRLCRAGEVRVGEV